MSDHIDASVDNLANWDLCDLIRSEAERIHPLYEDLEGASLMHEVKLMYSLKQNAVAKMGEAILMLEGGNVKAAREAIIEGFVLYLYGVDFRDVDDLRREISARFPLPV